MIIVKGDKSVVPALIEMAKTNENHLARLHALWTLEGLEALTPDIVRAATKDAHSHAPRQRHPRGRDPDQA